jgi:hypothetical protein
MRHFLNNIEIAPRNVLEIGLNTDFTGNPEVLSIDTDKVKLPREARDIILDHVTSVGVFEGIPYKIITDGGVTLEYYVDLTEQTIFGDYEIEVKIKRRKGKDIFFENAEGLSFELMNANSFAFPLVDIPYLIIPDNQGEMGVSLSVSLFVMTKEGIQAVKDLATAIQNLVEAVTPNASVPPVPPLGEIISLVLSVIAQLAYTIAITIAIIKLGQQMFELIFPKIRYYKGCRIHDLIASGCSYLGYTLSSNLLSDNSNLTLMPIPLIKEKKSIVNFIENDLNFSFTKGYPTAQDSVSTLGELINAVEIMFNARTKVNNGVVQIERRDYWQILTTNTILPALNDQDKRLDNYVLNTEEAWKRTYVHYQVDYSDFHTLDFFDPTDAEYSTEPVNVTNEDLVTIKGLNDVNIPFALAVRKNELNWIEKLAKGFFEVLDAIANLFGGNSNLASTIENRIGVTQIGQQFYSVTKILWSVNGKQPVNYANLLKASTIYNDYHKINEIQINGYKIFSEVPIRITSEDFVNLLDNNYAYINGLLCEILSINYIDEESKAIISYKEPYDYASGKVVTITLNS